MVEEVKTSEIESKISNLENRISNLESEINQIKEKISTIVSSLNEILTKHETRGLVWKDKAVQIIMDEGVISLQQLREMFTSLTYMKYKEKFLLYAKQYGIQLLKLRRRRAPEIFVYNPPESLIKTFELLNEREGVTQNEVGATNEEWGFILAILKKYYYNYLLFSGNSAVCFRSRLKKLRRG
jgi:regulator of replication initiation timing